MGWSWYLSIDMLLYALAPLLILPYLWRPRIGIAFAVVLIVVLIGVGWEILHSNGISALVNFGTNGAEKDREYSRLYYQLLWTRAPPYVIGVALAFILGAWRQPQIELNVKASLDGHVIVPLMPVHAANSDGTPAAPLTMISGKDTVNLSAPYSAFLVEPLLGSVNSGTTDELGSGTEPRASIGCCCCVWCWSPRAGSAQTARGGAIWSSWKRSPRLHACVCIALQVPVCAILAAVFFAPAGAYASIPSPWSSSVQLAYSALSRSIWAAALAVLLALCLSCGGPIASFLGASFWEPLGRLSFGVYLLHPIVMQATFLSLTALPRYSSAGTAGAFISTAALSYAAAACLYLLVEGPTASIEKAVLSAVAASLRAQKEKNEPRRRVEERLAVPAA